ncbi:hypothetical protein DRF63_03790 [Actinobacillus pleuropneumoniae]|uniref:YcgL domain-containing protein DRF63_03790 n=2 Tax=Actinobacillus pleuropneumoniae TaxID=715 RepID=A0ABM6X2R8_ACTPL|nr:hypothetical protein APPSER1_03795 [Actinobacillus pleuropneumoniae serovar 1 str. 4074]AXA21192.1 hypothetical protein DRF63_03790 [Actinobacillus pleuropneumoniae]EFM94468.1 hypothetical protein appser9_7730 [Actinobacillus pleuropneumoniae serovar 9 str. CVJ13261]UKH30511.1 hypothetical protein D1104_03840 [Actinobacillus pleuropneumoniae serovar 11 str. 56153]UKH34657.1 hypothetical protein D1102_03810 [Actinobacillus pleuropneumoniae serovar 9 str. CVJ13261]
MTMSTNLCAIYKSPKREGMFLYVAKRDQFDNVPEALRQMFGKPQFVMLFNLNGEKQLKRSKNEEVLQAIETQGFFLQMPPPPENLLKAFLEQNRGEA